MKVLALSSQAGGQIVRLLTHDEPDYASVVKKVFVCGACNARTCRLELVAVFWDNGLWGDGKPAIRHFKSAWVLPVSRERHVQCRIRKNGWFIGT